MRIPDFLANVASIFGDHGRHPIPVVEEQEELGKRSDLVLELAALVRSSLTGL